MKGHMNYSEEQRDIELPAFPVQYAAMYQHSDEGTLSSASDPKCMPLSSSTVTSQARPPKKTDEVLQSPRTPLEDPQDVGHVLESTELNRFPERNADKESTAVTNAEARIHIGTPPARTSRNGHNILSSDNPTSDRNKTSVDCPDSDLGHVLQAVGKVVTDTQTGAASETAIALPRSWRCPTYDYPPPINRLSIHTVHHHHYQKTCSQLALKNSNDWIFSYEELEKIARLDRHDEWKMLASKLRFDSMIDEAERRAHNERTSPTVIMLSLWMQTKEASRVQLKRALTCMKRKDILDDLEFEDHDDREFQSTYC